MPPSEKKSAGQAGSCGVIFPQAPWLRWVETLHCLRGGVSPPFTPAACYHVLNRGHARETIFHDDPDRLHFLHLLDRYRRRFGFRLYHYCLLSNHFHLPLQLPDARLLSGLPAGLMVAYGHHYRRRYQRVGHLFQGRCKTPAVEANNYLLRCGR